MQRTLRDHTPAQLRELLESWGEPNYRARQLAEGLFGRGAVSLDELTDLPKPLRQRLDREFGIGHLTLEESESAADGTTKYLFGLADGARIESVFLPRQEERQTYCLSSQVGCRMACVFCATGRMGLIRSLSAGEIVGQVLELRRRHPAKRNPNLVFMGMGEPLDNFEALADALETLHSEKGVGLSARRITVSTSGIVDGIRRLKELGKPYGLAVSLTTGNEADRRELMPIAARTPMAELLDAAADYGRHTHRKVTLECALIAGKNDGLEHAKLLLAIARRGPFKINLIPLNPVEKYAGLRPSDGSISTMVGFLWENGVVATVRDSQGRSVDAACGQLVERQRRGDLKTE
ncbi:MAG TPA: 23S rRNA (adenine(2503)-C(2))-methyltransferase RlmN [Candidatus Krumholzibacteria bacterium]|jgi:23S rRNA (adenine2503-C2)-methyltransferase